MRTAGRAPAIVNKPLKLKTMAKIILDKVQTLEQLESLGIGRIYYDVGYRGGDLGFAALDVAKWAGVDPNWLPRMFGCMCNYLGDGVRGAIYASDFDDRIPEAQASKLRALGEACVRVYESIETNDLDGYNNEIDGDSEPNWDAKATKAARAAGIRVAN